MKKIKLLAAVMVLCLAIGATGCGQPVSQSTASTASQQQTDTVVVAMNVESEPASGFDPALCLAIGATGCGQPVSQSTASTASQQQTDTVVVAMNVESEPASGFDPAYGWGAGEHVHEPLIQSTLVVTNADMSIGYDLATDMQVSEDGLTWTVTIRDDVKFTDGEPLTAADVAFTYNTVKAESTVNDFTMLDSAEALDNTTVVFHMNRPYSTWPYSMAVVGIVPEHAYGPDYGQNPIGSGRYILKQWDKGQQVILEANPDYYGEEVKMKKVVILFMSEDAAFAAAKAGQVDVAYTAGQQVILEANPDYYGEEVKMKKVVILFMSEDAAFAAAKAGQVDVAYTAASYTDQTIDGFDLLAVKTVDNRGINLPAAAEENGIGNDFTADVRVRQAINIGFDRQEMIDNVLNGYGTPAYSVCDGMPWYSEADEVTYDPQKAAALLEEAGWVLNSDGVREKDGQTASLNLLYPMGDSTRQALAADMANQLAELGIQTSTEGVGWDTAYDRAQNTPLVWGWGTHSPMEMYNIYHTVGELARYSPYANARVGWDTAYDRAQNTPLVWGWGTHSPMEMYNIYHTVGELARYSPYANARVDELMDQALASSDLEQSYTLWQQTQSEEIVNDVPWVWMVNVDHLYWVNQNLEVAQQKLHPHGHGWSLVNNVDQWVWKQA